MDRSRLVAELARFPAVLRAAVSGLAPEELRFRPAEGAWSILEVIGHLLDEEEEDFRPRLERTLRDPREDWTPIDPEARVVERDHHSADLAKLLDRFAAERARSVAFLAGLADPLWSNEKVHPLLGSLRAGDLFVSWVVHDQLHLRQVVDRLHELTLRHGGGYSSRYAEP